MNAASTKYLAEPSGDAPHLDAFIIEVEGSLLGCCLMGAPETPNLVAALKSPKRFVFPPHRVIYEALVALMADEVYTPDTIVLYDRLRRMGKLEEAGGITAVTALTLNLATGSNAGYYLGVILDNALRRGMFVLGNRIAEQAHDPTCDVFDQMQAAADFVDELRRELTPVTDATVRSEIENLMPIWLERRERALSPWADFSGITSGLTVLDNMTNGWQPGNLIVVAARPAMGKSSLACQFAAAAMLQNRRVAFFSLEMSAAELTCRIIAGQTGASVHTLTTGAPTDAEMQAIAEMTDDFKNRMIILDAAGIDEQQLQAECLRLSKQNKVELFILDYIQLMAGDANTRKDNLNTAVTRVMRTLKNIAMKTKTAFIALSQLSRAVEARTPQKPELRDLRDSGAIEQDADVVLGLWRPEYYGLTQFENGASAVGIANLIILKQRNGPTGELAVAFEASATRFADLPGDHRQYIYHS